uniref:BTB domain-containing protein n=1 Tax=Callorhinchus milii TaxID=7868 RepID=A0A4W3GI16_CALMI
PPPPIELEVADFGSTVLAQMNELRLQGRLCDIVVNIQDQCFRAHKVVLAASSPYFRDHMALTHGKQTLPLPCVWQELPLPGHPQPAPQEEPSELPGPCLARPQRFPVSSTGGA